jgi:hypothetical protein
MLTGGTYRRLRALLEDYSHDLGMSAEDGPLRTMRELTAGIVFTGSVQLSNAARLIARSPAELSTLVHRLSGNLANVHWDHRDWAEGILHHHVQDLDQDSLIVIDSTELAKPYARKMEHQDTVRDASRLGEPLVAGYWCWGAYHWDVEHDGLCPLMLRPYSTYMPQFLSENDQWRQYLWTLRQATEGKGIWLHDRGADRPEILSAFLQIQPRWIIRLREDRGLIGPDGTRRSAGAWADWALAHRNPRGHAVTLPVSLPREDVWQTPHPPRLDLLVPTYTFGNDERWVLLTCGLFSGPAELRQGPRQGRHGYALRWRAEDAKRMLGQIWHVERFLVRSFLAIERLLWCVVAAGGFLAMLRWEESELVGELQSEVLYHEQNIPCLIPDYRLARGIQTAAAQGGVVAMLNNA